jgi:Na+/H+ antiporter NhaD/arsenite permease-like protein
VSSIKNSLDQSVRLSPAAFLAGCLAAAVAVWAVGLIFPLPPWLLALEVFLTVLALFVFGSSRYRLDKNALTYGAVLVISATFWSHWWPSSMVRQGIHGEGIGALWRFIRVNLLTLQGLDRLIHADTMLFILGLTFFVASIAQTRLLESASFAVLRRSRGNVLITIALLAAVVSFASGILDGVSMIGLMIRTMVIILLLSKSGGGAVVYAVMVSTVVTTVCGMWLAYGEPPNLIMKANLAPHLDNLFFLRYCLPIAFGSYLIVLWNLRRSLHGRRIDMVRLDILDTHTADVRFLQAMRHGEVFIPMEFVQDHHALLGSRLAAVMEQVKRGEPLGEAMVQNGVPADTRLFLLGEFTSENMAGTLDDYYIHVHGQAPQQADESARRLRQVMASVRRQRIRAQRLGALAFVPFIGFLIWHAANHDVPLFLASFAGFAVAFLPISHIPNMRRLALRDARHEFSEYLFLIPLFFSIALLQRTGFFEQLAGYLNHGIETFGASHMAFAQFAGTTVLSAILDNNVVADFAGRALRGLDETLIHLFATAQIAGYAAGGCWTHIGSAQSVMAYSYIRKEVDQRFTPFEWVKLMTPLVLEIGVFMTAAVYLIGWIVSR